MIHAIRLIGVPTVRPGQVAAISHRSTEDTSFQDCLARSLKEAGGGPGDAADAGIAVEMMSRVRNELVHAYQELQNIRV